MSLLALGYAALRSRWIFRQPTGDQEMQRIPEYVSQGAVTFLSREYRILIPFVLVVGGFPLR